MTSYWAALTSAVWLGILTSISPCPLATNVAAISYIAKQVDRPWQTMMTGLLYTIGRTVTYVTLGVLLVASILSAPHVSDLLQQHMNQVLGPVLIVVGMLLLDLLRLPAFGISAAPRLSEHLGHGRFYGAFLLGVLFALSFCPISAALFFGSLIPLATASRSSAALPALYGLGTAMPVFAFAVLTALGAKSVAGLFQRVTSLEPWARRITGTVFVLIGVYFCWIYLIS